MAHATNHRAEIADAPENDACMMRATGSEVRPLPGIRFDPRRSGAVGPLLAPPYDVVAAPAPGATHSIALIENVDVGAPGDQHAIAASRYRDWLQQGILRRDQRPAMYLHHHCFTAGGAACERTALLARVRLVDWAERIVLPHEGTMPGPRLERGARLRATGANLSPLYMLFRDAGGEIRQMMSSRLGESAAAAERDNVGGAHRLVHVSDPAFHREVARLLHARTLFVADGHHRYEAALAYRDERRQSLGWRPDAASEFVLVMLAAVEDPGVIVRPTHRLLLDAATDPSALLVLLRRWFNVVPAWAGNPLATDGDIVCRLVLGSESGVWDVRVLPGNPHAALLPRERGPSWRSLPVAAVETVLESAAGVGGGRVRPRIAYVVDDRVAIERVRHGEAQAAFLLPTPRLDRILAVAEEGDLLPPKSTWFEPKAPAGLVIHDLVG